VIDVNSEGEMLLLESITPETLTLDPTAIEVVEAIAQGPPGPPGSDDFDLDLVLIYSINKL
jgi:hypothetical protein